MNNDHADMMSERRDREVERSGGKQIASPFFAKVVGVSFVPGYPDNLHSLAEHADRAHQAGEALVVVLRRNPDNQYDPNAIEVHVPTMGDTGFIGHLTRPIAARLAPEMDAGVRWRSRVESVLIDPLHMDRPGISIKCGRLPEET